MAATDSSPPLSSLARFCRERWLLVTVLAAAFLIEGYLAVFVRQNDFSCHMQFGAYFLKSEPYFLGGNYYPLGRSFLNAGLASMHTYAARGLSYTLAWLGLGLSVWMWARMSGQPRAAIGFGLALLLLAPVVQRDFDECGLQIHLLFLLSAAAYAWWRERKLLGGFWLACAIIYKLTPLLFVPFLLWKREFRTVAAMLVFTVALSMLPAFYLGWDATLAAHQHWVKHVYTIMQHAPDAYPSSPSEPPKPHNQSLTALLARYLESYPPGHPLHLEHPWFRQFGTLSVASAKLLIQGMVLLLGLVMAWRFRHCWQPGQSEPEMAREWAVACLFTALMSPVCWKQHLVLAVPTVFLLVQALRTAPQLSKLRLTALGMLTLVLWLLGQEVVGRENAVLFQSYKLITLSLLLAAAVLLQLPGSAAIVARPVASAERRAA